MTDRIDFNELGVDDVAINDVKLFRLERMSETGFFICCYTTENEKDERYKERIVFWANVIDGKLIVSAEEGAENVPGDKHAE